MDTKNKAAAERCEVRSCGGIAWICDAEALHITDTESGGMAPFISAMAQLGFAKA